MRIKDVNASVSLAQAMTSLREAQDLLKASKNQNEEWQNPLKLLDITAAALDDAGLALGRLAEEEEDEEKKDQDEDPLTQQARQIPKMDVEQMAQSILKERNAILDATRTVVTENWLEDIPEDEILIVWATHTGSSRKFALSLQSNLGGGSRAINVKDLCLPDLQKRQKVLFVCSTFGCGRPPRDAEVFFSALQVLGGKGGSKSILCGLEFAVAALGNSKFGSFCKFGKDLSRRLLELGATEVIPVALLDCRKGKARQKKTFVEWQDRVMELEGKSPILADVKPTRRFSSGRTDAGSRNSTCIVL